LKGIVIDGHACDDPDCLCRDVYLRAVEFDSKDIQFYHDYKGMNAIYTKIIKKRINDGQFLSAALDIDSGNLTARGDQPLDTAMAELLIRVDRLIEEKKLLKLFRTRWNIAKKVNAKAYMDKDWSWWEPGVLVAWREVFPDDWSLLVYEDDGKVFLDDSYCVTPGCSCKEVAISILKTSSIKTEALGTIFLNFATWRVKNIEEDTASYEKLDLIWAEFNDTYPDLKQIVVRRHKEIRKAMADVFHQRKAKQNYPKAISAKVGRNAPCPCGSGKKYKKCCLGKSGK
jgi:hypothetical protein